MKARFDKTLSDIDVDNDIESKITVGLVRRQEDVALSEDAVERLRLRKKLELELIMKHDTTVMYGCWYLIDSFWLHQWSNFVNSSDDDDVDPPGPVSSLGLLDSVGKPLPGLRSGVDYRGVSPITYFIFVDFYGKVPSSIDLCRYIVDIYKPPAPPEKLVSFIIQYRIFRSI
jgi:hypothetical protein